jgi:hypothetical protein
MQTANIRMIKISNQQKVRLGGAPDYLRRQPEVTDRTYNLPVTVLPILSNC